MRYFKVSIRADDEYDELHIRAETKTEAETKFNSLFKDMPDNLLTWQELDQEDISEGTEFL
jgi:hypothetical protein